MGSLELEGFTYTDVDSAREEIYVQLKHVGNRKVIYFDGWHGFGASAVLRSIATMLPSRRATPELCFDRIIYIDFSKWKNRRAVQRIIVEELKLDPFVMAILNEQDEEDDFNKVDESSRNEIDRVGQVIAQTLRDSKFMLIFLNGSDGEVDIGAFGIPLTRWGNSVMIWTFDRCCLTLHGDHSGVADKLRYTHLFFHYRRQYFMPMKKLTGREFHGLLQQHAVTIVDRNPCMVDIDPAMVANCCLYELLLHFNFHATTKFDWIAHASNYWICDGIIQQDIARDIANALRREINWECDHFLVEELLTSFTEDSVYEDHSKKHFKPSFVVMKDHVLYEKEPYCWISITPNPSRDTVYNKITRSPIKGGRKYLPAEASSFFLASGTSDHSRSLRNGLFKQSTKLGVLILYCCAFNFASPPFLKCRSLRFLGIDHCTDGKAIKGEDHTEWLCLYSLWVLDLRHTDWREILSQEKIGLMANIRELNIVGVRGWQYTSHLQCRLPNLLRLRIIKPTCQWETPEDVDNSLTYETRMEILDLSGNTDMKNLPTSLQKASSLVLLVLDGCDQLETVERIPHSLESFSFDGHGLASQWTHNVKLPPKQFDVSTTTDNMDIRVSKISLEGCTHLDNLFLRGLPNLVELDLSGTAVKILDFKTMVVQVPMLKRLYLIGCKHLRAIIAVYNMYTKIKPDLELLCIDTRAGIVCPRPSINKTRSFRLQVHVIVVDTRLTRSFTDMLPPYTHGDTPKDVYYNIHVTGSPRHDEVVQFEATGKEDKIGPCDQESLQQLIPAGQYSDVLSIVCDLPKQAFPQPPTTKLDRHIEIAERSCNVESELDGRLGKLMGFYTESLHVHDVMLRDIVPHVDYWWNELRWFRVERCPKVDTVFHTYYYGFAMLETLWVSDLLMARWIWPKLPRRDNCWLVSFGNLQHLHLRSCPTLKFVIPVWVSSFPNLETLHIIHCGDLSHVFVLDEKHEQEVITHGVLFPKLKTVHLHDLPKLNKICEVKMVAPALESIKIRGCSGLRRLPSVGDRARGTKNPTVEIEKDVWDALEWDADHRPDHFEAPVHSRYYKKKLPRVSVLR